jgi:hypothetical protein
MEGEERGHEFCHSCGGRHPTQIIDHQSKGPRHFPLFANSMAGVLKSTTMFDDTILSSEPK